MFKLTFLSILVDLKSFYGSLSIAEKCFTSRQVDFFLATWKTVNVVLGRKFCHEIDPLLTPQTDVVILSHVQSLALTKHGVSRFNAFSNCTILKVASWFFILKKGCLFLWNIVNRTCFIPSETYTECFNLYSNVFLVVFGIRDVL